jgi:hypothetical protein
MELFDKIDKLKVLLDRKDELKDQTKSNNAAIEELKAQIADIMIQEECPSISRNGFKYSLQQKVCYSKKSEADLQAAGIDFFETLRNNQLGDLIVETVNPRTLQSTLTQLVADNGELPDELSDCINVYEMMDIAKRKETSRKALK